jgi:hypothetical protein
MKTLIQAAVVTLFAASAAQAADPLDTGLVLRYSFDGNFADSSGNGRDPVQHNVTLTADRFGRPDSSCLLNGSSSYLTASSVPEPTDNAFTWAAWVRLDSLSGNNAEGPYLMSRCVAINQNPLTPRLFLLYSGAISFNSCCYSTTDGTVTTQPGSIGVGRWTHIAIVSQRITDGTGGSRTVYVDGQPAATYSVPSYGSTGLGVLQIGADRFLRAESFVRGAIDDVRVYDRELSASEVGRLAIGTDCNNDGIPDYDQCVGGTLPDYNQNSIPDCCERGTPCVPGSYPVEWPASGGGNGHWYRVAVTSSNITWPSARDAASQLGGHLVALTSSAENTWVHTLTTRMPGAWGTNGHPFWTYGPWVGGSRATSGDTQWKWITGEAWGYASWYPGQPDSTTQTVISFGGGGPASPTWADTFIDEPVRSYVIEWEADCNNDGLVDYGQILRGTLADTNGNGIPDMCEVPTCHDGDLYPSGRIDGADLAALLSEWGTANANTRADLNHDGMVDGADLGFLLSFWGPCPN